ncbi:MAG: hypothetical protein K6T83_07355 [Alicyclobacillus sp.]|nr:hypothetical protein [Alicyclobacillus sp.]
MASVSLVNGWQLVSDSNIERFQPERDECRPEPLSDPNDAYRTGFLSIAVAGRFFGFAHITEDNERYVIIDSETSSITHANRLRNSSADFPSFEYELIPDPSLLEYVYDDGRVQIDVGNRLIMITKEK